MITTSSLISTTLYPRNAGLMQEIGGRILRYLTIGWASSDEQARFQKVDYFQRYGTTLRGFVVERPDIDPEDYLHFVHDIDLTQHIGPNPALVEMLRSLPQRKVIFTNATVEQRTNAGLGLCQSV
ncbi:MAG: hypothetical protein U0559_02660 [Anaerolineae bacterium]